MGYAEEKKEAMEYLMQRETKKEGYKMTITVPAQKMLELAYDIMCNYPEYSFCLKCIGWKYSKGVFIFYDDEEDKRHVVTTNQIAEKGLPKFIEMVLAGKCKGLGISAENVLDAGQYDSIATDAVVQLTIFGEVIYG